MLVVLICLLIAVVTAVAVVAYVAFPHQGRTIPRASWLTRALQGAVDRAGLDPDDDEAAQGGSLTSLQQQWSERRTVNRAADRAADKTAHKAPHKAAHKEAWSTDEAREAQPARR